MSRLLRQVPPGRRRRISGERTEEAAHGPVRVPSVSAEGHGRADRRLSMAERGGDELRSRQAGVLGCVRRDRPENVRARPAWKLDEVGWQVAVASNLRPYFGAESIAPTTEAAQAGIYSALLRYVACDPAFDSVLFFGLQDEPSLDRWQAGLIRADGTLRPSYHAVKATIAETAGNCAGRMRSWRHSTVVAGADATFRRDRRLPSRVDSWSFTDLPTRTPSSTPGSVASGAATVEPGFSPSRDSSTRISRGSSASRRDASRREATSIRSASEP